LPQDEGRVADWARRERIDIAAALYPGLRSASVVQHSSNDHHNKRNPIRCNCFANGRHTSGTCHEQVTGFVATKLK
jgi:hypothetical protein